jgi:hypothetical protein
MILEDGAEQRKKSGRVTLPKPNFKKFFCKILAELASLFLAFF